MTHGQSLATNLLGRAVTWRREKYTIVAVFTDDIHGIRFLVAPVAGGIIAEAAPNDCLVDGDS